MVSCSLETEMSTTIDEKYVLGFIASLTLCDHMGDVLSDCQKVLKDMGYEFEWEDGHELWDRIADIGGVKTLWGSDIERSEDG